MDMGGCGAGKGSEAGSFVATTGGGTVGDDGASGEGAGGAASCAAAETGGVSEEVGGPGAGDGVGSCSTTAGGAAAGGASGNAGERRLSSAAEGVSRDGVGSGAGGGVASFSATDGDSAGGAWLCSGFGSIAPSLEAWAAEVVIVAFVACRDDVHFDRLLGRRRRLTDPRERNQCRGVSKDNDEGDRRSHPARLNKRYAFDWDRVASLRLPDPRDHRRSRPQEGLPEGGLQSTCWAQASAKTMTHGAALAPMRDAKPFIRPAAS